MKYLFTTLLCIITVLTTLSQDRDVIWVHGINSGANFWNEYAADFQRQRRVDSDNQTHVSLTGVNAMANDVRNGTRADAGPQTIGIGHSMGGLALREIHARIDAGHIGGMITVGSPLNGARIINAWQNGEVNGYISHSVKELMKGPKREFFIGYIIVNTGLRVFTGRDLAEVIRDAALDGVPIALLEGRSPDDMQEGSRYMNNARNYSVRIPNISLYGNENSPVHYRIASTSQGNPDTELVEVVRNARAVYNTFYVKNMTGFGILKKYKARGWKAGRDYLDSGSEKGWNNLIGATRTEERRVCSERLVCDDEFYYTTCYPRGSNPSFECRNCWQTSCRTYTQHYNQPSDGLLHESTQLGQRTNATTSSWSPDVTFEARGANHNEYDQHPGTERQLNRIFDVADAQTPNFFRTP